MPVCHVNLYKIECCSTFKNLSGELVLELWNTSIQKKFYNLSSNLRHWSIYVYSIDVNDFIYILIVKCSFFLTTILLIKSSHFTSNNLLFQLIYFQILKSLHIVHDNEREDERLDMIQQVRNLNHGKFEFTRKFVYKIIFSMAVFV
jgi:hypothetical protein